MQGQFWNWERGEQSDECNFYNEISVSQITIETLLCYHINFIENI